MICFRFQGMYVIWVGCLGESTQTISANTEPTFPSVHHRWTWHTSISSAWMSASHWKHGPGEQAPKTPPELIQQGTRWRIMGTMHKDRSVSPFHQPCSVDGGPLLPRMTDPSMEISNRHR
ncbi:hypothetical protein L210DRAFT_2221491 [Boletus edulis BED1]|uniref:Secreted protein n=1 Tax=Boletus edulis BED1 TaxID=1328754 RepID=A0AAD4BCY4_BOLED|nr:hypothetical protein L210DRAFT_2221491 [Boletus edulis BED1]